MFFLLYKQTDDGVFDDFPKISDHFPKISQNCSEGQTNVPEHFPRISENSRRYPKIAEDCRRLSRKTRRIFRWGTNYFKYNLRDKLGISETIDIFTCEDIVSFFMNLLPLGIPLTFIRSRVICFCFYIIKGYTPHSSRKEKRQETLQWKHLLFNIPQKPSLKTVGKIYNLLR